MTQASIHEAKTNLSKLIQLALAGEEVIIANAGKPVVKLVAIAQTPAQRVFGGWEGEVWMAEDFDAELEDFKEFMPE